MPSPDPCRERFGAGHQCVAGAGHNAEHLCPCGARSAVYMVTQPGTQLQLAVAVPRRTRPCWRCRARGLARRPQRHWNCIAPPDLHHD